MRQHHSARPSAAYVKVNGRIAQYGTAASAQFWDEHWSELSDAALSHALRATRRLGVTGSALRRYLPTRGTILEAGCGSGIWVRRLGTHGRQCVGLDYAMQTLARSKAVCPELQLVAGDMSALPFPDESLAGYISLGVVEHLQRGPAPLLSEAARVLAPGGVACVSVPYLNRLRRRTPLLTLAEARDRGLEFYQYFFSEDDLSAELRSAGLQPNGKSWFQNSYKLLRPRLPFLGYLERMLPRQSLWTPLFDFIPGVPALSAHMMLTIAVKPGRS